MQDRQFMLLIYDDETQWARMSEEERDSVMGEYGAFTDELRTAGKMVAGDPLEPTTTAKTVRMRDGQTVMTDGPFAETKEQLGGYYLIEADSLDEALEWAAKIPSARFGSIEIRPVVPVPARAES